jgi:colanic acid biosynthesis glycosyl transferase WcaI
LSKPFRITIVNRYFWPETVLANDIAAWLAAAGHRVEVITSQPSYNPEASLMRRPARETWNGVEIRRLPLLPERSRGLVRHVNNLLFILLSTAVLLFGARRDVVWSTSIPPVLQPWLLRLATAIRGARLIYFVQDIYPEIALLMRMMRPGAASRLIAAADSWTMRRADAVATLSEDMADCIRSRGKPRTAPRIINNFAAIAPRAAAPGKTDATAPCRFVFAGNIGRFQNLEETLALFAGLSPGTAALEFLGEGRLKQTLSETARAQGLSSVRFHPYLPADAAFAFVEACDVGIVSLVPGLYRYAYPSKTFTYLAAGLPLLCLIEEESELAREITARRLGVAVSWSAPPARRREAVELLAASHRQFADGLIERARPLFDRDAARARWLDLFEEVLEAPRPTSSEAASRA